MTTRPKLTLSPVHIELFQVAMLVILLSVGCFFSQMLASTWFPLQRMRGYLKEKERDPPHKASTFPVLLWELGEESKKDQRTPQ